MSEFFERKPRTERESDLLGRAARLLPAAARTATHTLGGMMIVREAHGSRIVDESGNEYIDYLLGSGPIFLGHAHPAVVRAVQDAAARGSSFMLPGEDSILLAEEIVEATHCAERITYGNTGSDAVLFAIRLARAARGRERILKFEGAYHGQADAVLMSNQWTTDSSPGSAAVPNSLGIPEHCRDEVVVAPWNDGEATAALIERHADELAAVICEPMQRTFPPRPGFLELIREITAERGIPLIFDEVVTGFRLAYESAQGYYRVTPDLCAMGKSLSGGHPISVVAGRSDFMTFAEGVRRLTGDYVSLTGTFSGNPVSCAAARAVLAELRTEGAYEALFARGERLREGLRRHFEKAGIAVQICGEPPAFEPWFSEDEVVDFRSARRADAGLSARFGQLLFDRGVIKGHEKFFVSMAHGDADIDYTLDAAQDAIAELARTR